MEKRKIKITRFGEFNEKIYPKLMNGRVDENNQTKKTNYELFMEHQYPRILEQADSEHEHEEEGCEPLLQPEYVVTIDLVDYTVKRTGDYSFEYENYLGPINKRFEDVEQFYGLKSDPSFTFTVDAASISITLAGILNYHGTAASAMEDAMGILDERYRSIGWD